MRQLNALAKDHDESVSPDSECTVTIAEMAKMPADLESNVGRRIPRPRGEEEARWHQAAEKRLKTRQKAVEAATGKRDQLQHSLQAAQEKLHETLTLRQE